MKPPLAVRLILATPWVILLVLLGVAAAIDGALDWIEGEA
jgi:hypothetical protein